MRRFSKRTWLAVGAVGAVVVAAAVASALSTQPKDDVLGVEYERSSTSAPATTAPVDPTSTPEPTGTPSPPAGSAPAAGSSHAGSPSAGASTGSVAGVVTRGGSPLAGARVKLALPGGERSTVTGSDGSFALGDVPAGRHQLQVVTPEEPPSCDDAGNCLGEPSQTANRQVDVTAGRQSRVDIAFD